MKNAVSKTYLEERLMLKKSLVTTILASAMFSTSALAAGFSGDWMTYDEKTGDAKSVVTVRESNGTLNATVKQVLVPGEENSVCTECKGELEGKPVAGLPIITGMKVDGNKASGGQVMDPENGKFYKSKMELKGNTLVVKGCIGPICRAQEWTRK
jgi:uncharacterized protein (DUF2147 family)